MFQKEFEHFSAYTLEPEEVLENHDSETGGFARTHEDGWTICGVIQEDYMYWVNDFIATHYLHGTVMGNFEKVVCYDSEEGLKDFMEKHPPQLWDYDDI